MKKILIIFILFFCIPSYANKKFEVDGKIIHPIIIDCLFSYYSCWQENNENKEENPEVVYFNNDNMSMAREYYYHRSEAEDTFAEWLIKLPFAKHIKYFRRFYNIKSPIFDTDVGYMKYKVLFKLLDFSYTPNKNKFASINKKDGDYSYWLIEAESTGGDSLIKGKQTVVMAVELYKAKRENEKNYVRALKIIPFERIDIKYDSRFELGTGRLYYEDRNQDGIKDIIFYQKTGNRNIENYVEEIHFFTENKTEVFENEYRTNITHWIGLMPNLDQKIYDLIKKEKPNVKYNFHITNQVIFDKSSLPSDQKFNIKTLKKTIITVVKSNPDILTGLVDLMHQKHPNAAVVLKAAIAKEKENFNRAWAKKIAKNYAKNISANYICSEINKVYNCEVITSNY